MKIKPIGERVLVKAKKAETKTKTGIVLPNTVSKEAPIIGEVLAVGNEELEKLIPVASKVIYARYAGTEIKDEDEKYILLSKDDVLGIVEE